MSAIIIAVLAVLLVLSGLFDLISWAFNIPAIIILVALWFVVMYNKFIRLKQRMNEAWADIDVQLKRRYDLIPNLMSTVKGYMEHERETFESITDARAKAMSADGIKEQEQAENMLSSTLRSLFAVAENYPDLKANANFLELQRELSDTENKIQAARRFFNSNVRNYNTLQESFPSNIIAGAFNFDHREYFELEGDSAARENIDVAF